MGHDKRAAAKEYTPADDDTLKSIAERESTPDHPLTWQEIARFNWGTDNPDVVDEFLRDELGCYKRGDDKRFVLMADVPVRTPLLIPQPFKKTGLATTKTHTLKVTKKKKPPKQFESCIRISDITFEFDKDKIRESETTDVEEVAAEMNRRPNAKAMIFGHTDAVGNEAYNKDLSERRAKTVYDYLTTKLGISADRFMAMKHMGCSLFNLIDDVPYAHEPNRRVAVFLFNPDRLPNPPCAYKDLSPCKKHFGGGRSKASFRCSFYDSIAKECPAEGGGPAVIVNPTITTARQVVIVKKPHTNPARLKVTLKTDSAFDGSGTFTRSSDAIRFFTAATGGTEITFNGTDNVFTGPQLTSGVDVFAEGAKPSAALDDVTLKLTLTAGSAPVGPEASQTMTSVEVTLDICQSRTSPTTDPVPLSAADKINTGRFVQVQDAGNHCGRAKLIVRQAKPAAFAGELEITAIDNKVQLFADEVAAAGQAAIALPHALANSAIPADGSAFWVQGAAVSGALRDTGFRLGIKNVEPDGDKVAVTVVNFTRIQATIKSTPPNTARAGIALPVDHVFRSTHIDPDFTANPPLLLMRDGQPDTALLATVAPANLPLRWQAIRNPDDHASLGAAGDIPTVTPTAGHPDQAVLDANNKGSFRVRCYIDCNGNNQYNDGEPSIPLNLVLADVELDTDNSAGLNDNLFTQCLNGRVRVRNGAWPGTWADATSTPAAGTRGAGMTMELVADVTGGGADGRLGLDNVFGGLVNNLAGNDIRLTYRDTTGPAPVNYTIRNRYVTNPTDATGMYGGSPMFRPTDPAAGVLTFPVLDTGRDPGGIGADTALMSRSGMWDPAPTDRPVGRRYTLRCIDSPGRTFLRRHPDHANALLAQIHYVQQFTANFCFWTNITGVRTQSGDPADRVYSVVRKMDWEAIGDWNVNSTNAVPVIANTNPHRINVSNRQTFSPIDRAQDNNIEVRPPSGITTAIAWVTT